MKNMSRYFAIGALIAFSSFGVFAAAATGNCQEKAVSLTSDGGTAVTLTRLWDSDANDWEDAATAVKDQAGGYWFKVTVPVGSDCVFYIDPATVVSDNGGYFIGIDNVYAEDVYSVFDFYDDPATGTQYWYIRSSDWDEEDSGNVTFYIRIGGDYPGVRCTFYHYCNGGRQLLTLLRLGANYRLSR